MNNSDFERNKKLITYINDKDTLKLIDKIVKGNQNISFEENLSLDRDISNILSISPDLILLEITKSIKQEIKFIEEINALLPTTIIIAIFSKANRVHIQDVLLAGARAFSVQPLKRKDFESTIRRTVELQNRLIRSTKLIVQDSEEEVKQHKTVIVFSPRGGVGTTTIASNMAIAIKKNAKKKTLLLDGKQFFGHLDIFFNVMSQNNLIDLIPHLSELDQVILDEVIVKHVSGVDLLLGPNSLPAAQGLHPENYFSLLEKLQEIYDYIVIDGGHSVSENTVTLLDVSQVITLVINPDLASLKDARDFITVCKSLSYPDEKLVVIINNAGVRNSLDPAEISKALGREVFDLIPNDSNGTLNAINYGVPVYFQDKKRKFSRSIDKFSKRMIRYLNKQANNNKKKDEKVNLDLLDKSSKFG